MPSQQVVQRLVSGATGIESQRLRTGNIDEEELAKVARAMGELSNTSIYVDDTPAISPMELRAKARRLHAEHPMDLIIVDYLQLMQAGIKMENRVQEVSYISRQLKALASELHVPVLACSQLSRAVESRADKRPVLSDLRESGSIEQDADVVMFIYREEMYLEDTFRPNIADIIVAKHRNGPTGQLSLRFMKEQAKFVNLEPVPEEMVV
jgi:replicative DNA helicase